MRKVAIVTDSTVNLPPAYIAEYGISVAPQIIIWGDKTYEDGVDIQPGEFYSRLGQATVMPTSSQVSASRLRDIYNRLLENDYDILTVAVSSQLSGTLNSVTQALSGLPEERMAVVDSYGASMALGFQVLQAARAAANGASLKECRAVAERARMQTNIYFVVDTLDFLHRGGRIGGAAHFLGTTLNLKPILTLKDGKIEPAGKVRTLKKALEKMLGYVEKELEHSRQVRISVLHANVPDEGNALLEECNRRFHPAESILSEVSPVIGVHTGPGTIGVAYLRDM